MVAEFRSLVPMKRQVWWCIPVFPRTREGKIAGPLDFAGHQVL